MRALSLALALAGAVVACVFALQMLGGKPRVAAKTGVRPVAFVVETRGKPICQPGEPLARTARSMQLTIGTYGAPGPELDAELRRGGRVVGRGHLAQGWKQGVVRMPLRMSHVRGRGPAQLCLKTPRPAHLTVGGEIGFKPAATLGGTPANGRLSVVYLTKPQGLADILPAITARYGHGNARWLGGWTWWLMALLLLGAAVAAGAALRRAVGPRDELPLPIRVARPAALVAVLVAAVWALLTPPFHVPDEISHVGYAQYVAEAGKLPKPDSGPEYSTEERRLLDATLFYGTIGRPDTRPPNTPAAEAALRKAETHPGRRDNGRNATTASANPPLYYLVEAPVYRAVPGSLLDKLVPMRLLSVLFGGLTVLFVTLFVSELLPRSPWTWAAGGLAVALQPMVGFIDGGINPDGLLFACSAATLYGCARLLRHGLTTSRAVSLGVVVAAGVLTKPLFLALVPPTALALLAAALRTPGAARRRLTSVWWAAAAFLVPVAVYEIVGRAAFDHPYFGSGSPGTAALSNGGGGGGRMQQLSFAWQLFLPRLPFLNDQLPGLPLRNIWLSGFLGRLGWLDYGLPGWVYDWGLAFAIGLVVAAIATLVVHRRRLRGRLVELGVYVIAAASVAAVIGLQDFGSRQFEQARYLFPLLALYGGLVGVAARLAGRRAGPAVAIALTMLAAVHTITALTTTVTRFYS
jgi:hypothetical protein